MSETVPRGRSGRRCRVTDRGSATVWFLALIGVIWFTAVAVVLVASARAVRHQAAAAADLAALAAAEQARQGQARACDAAGRVAGANGGRLKTCLVSGAIAEVAVEVPLPSLFGTLALPDGVMMRARAGPVIASHGQPWSEAQPWSE